MGLLRTALQKRIVMSAIGIALVVGTALNCINQGQNFWSGLDVSWAHIFLNYLVPYCVASYSAAKNEIARKTAE